MNNYKIEQIDKSLFDYLKNNSKSFDLLFEQMRVDLYPNYNSFDYSNKYRLLLKAQTHKSPRSAEMFCWKDEENYEGILTIHYYKWELIARQLCYKFTDDFIEILRFSNLLPSVHNIKNVAEIATIWVNPSSRYKGIGTQLFNFGLNKIKQQLQQGDYFFIAAISNIKAQDCDKLYRFMKKYISKEGHYDPNQTFVGNKVPLDVINEILKLDIRDYRIADKAKPIEFFSIKAGMNYIGHFRTLSKIFGAFVP